MSSYNKLQGSYKEMVTLAGHVTHVWRSATGKSLSPPFEELQMSIMKLLVVVVVLALVIGGTLQYMGYIKLSSDGAHLSTPIASPNMDDYDAGYAAYIANKFDAAVDDYKKALAKTPDSPKAAEAMYGLGMCYEGLNKNDEAVDAYKAFVDKFPNDPNARKASERIELLKGSSGK